MVFLSATYLLSFFLLSQVVVTEDGEKSEQVISTADGKTETITKPLSTAGTSNTTTSAGKSTEVATVAASEPAEVGTSSNDKSLDAPSLSVATDVLNHGEELQQIGQDTEKEKEKEKENNVVGENSEQSFEDVVSEEDAEEKDEYELVDDR